METSEAKKIVIINGSPRKEGNCSYLASTFKKELPKQLPTKVHGDNILIFSPHSHKIAPCRGCEKCHTSKDKSGQCVIADDFNDLATALESADVLIWISPLYFGTMSAQMKAIVDRFQMFWSRNVLAGDPKGLAANRSKPAIAFYVCGHLDPFKTTAATGASLLPLKYASNTAGYTLEAAKRRGKGDIMAIIGPDKPGSIKDSYYRALINDALHMTADIIWEI